MAIVFYISGAIAVVAAMAAIVQLNAIHALLYLALSFLAVAMVFYTLGAPFVAALEVIVYVGAIVVLFVFVVMLLNMRMVPGGSRLERESLAPRNWLLPAALVVVLAAELAYLFATGGSQPGSGPVVGTGVVEPKQVSLALFGPYILGVELASFVLLAGLVGAYHLGRLGSQDAGPPGGDPHV